MRDKKSTNIFLCLSLMIVILLSGCRSVTPPAYDVGLESDTESLAYESGGFKDSIPIKLDNRSYQILSKDTQVYLSYHLYSEDGELLRHDNARTDLGMIPARGRAVVDLEFRVPMLAGGYIVEVDLVREGVSWYGEQGNKTLRIPVTVQNDYVPEYLTQILVDQEEIIIEAADDGERISSNDTDVSKDGDVNNASGENAAVFSLTVSIKNLGTIPIYTDGELTPFLSYRIYEYEDSTNTTGELVYEGKRNKLETDIEPGNEENLTIQLNLDEMSLFEENGTDLKNKQYIMVFDLVQEGVCWYADRGGQTAEVRLEVYSE